MSYDLFNCIIKLIHNYKLSSFLFR